MPWKYICYNPFSCKSSKILRSFVLLFVFLLPLLCFYPFVQADNSTPKVYDNAGLFSSNEVSQLEKKAAKYGKKGKVDIVIVTVNDENSPDCEIVLEDLYDSIGFGYNKSYGDTVMLIIDLYNRDVCIQGYGEAQTKIAQKQGDQIREKITPSLSKGAYYKACQEYIELSAKYMKIKFGINPNNILLQWWFQLIVTVVVAVAVVACMTIKSSGSVTTSDTTYLDASNSGILDKRDDYIRTTTTRVKKPEENSKDSSGKSSGSGSGTSSGGNSHSSSRGKF